MKFSRQWAMPNRNTFSIPPIRNFVNRYISGRTCIIDPFARDCKLGHITNDMNPHTSAKYHMDAVAFLEQMEADRVRPDCILFDPPYSPRQISECYRVAGKKAGMKDTQNGRFISACKKIITRIAPPDCIVLSFGWNSAGMGKDNWEIDEILIVPHGGAHNDTICMAEHRKTDLFSYAGKPAVAGL